MKILLDECVTKRLKAQLSHPNKDISRHLFKKIRADEGIDEINFVAGWVATIVLQLRRSVQDW